MIEDGGLGADVPDYSRPSVDVDRRSDGEWLWGVTQTVRAERLAPIVPGVDYSITVKVQQAATELDPEATFAGVYARAFAIANARCDDFAREDDGVHRWVMCHAWRTLPIGSGSIGFAVVMMGLLRATAGQVLPPGEPAPTTEKLMMSGGATLEEMQRRSPQRATEVFVEFDHRHPTASAESLFTYSYGERVAVQPVESFEPFVRRAENQARAYQAVVDVFGRSPIPATIALLEWYMADDVVTVDLHLRP